MKKTYVVLIFLGLGLINVGAAGLIGAVSVALGSSAFSYVTAIPVVFGVVSCIIAMQIWQGRMPKVILVLLTSICGILGSGYLLFVIFSTSPDVHVMNVMVLLGVAVVSGLCAILTKPYHA